MTPLLVLSDLCGETLTGVPIQFVMERALSAWALLATSISIVPFLSFLALFTSPTWQLKYFWMANNEAWMG